MLWSLLCMLECCVLCPNSKKSSDRNSDRINNHMSPKRTKKRRHSNSMEPRLKRRRSRSPVTDPSHSERSHHSDAAYKPISSPIKLSGSSAAEDSGMGTPVEDSKVPPRYQNKYDNHKHKKHRSHRHERHHKREKHRRRERSRSRNMYDSRPEHRRNDSKRHHVSHRRRNDGHVYKWINFMPPYFMYSLFSSLQKCLFEECKHRRVLKEGALPCYSFTSPRHDIMLVPFLMVQVSHMCMASLLLLKLLLIALTLVHKCPLQYYELSGML